MLRISFVCILLTVSFVAASLGQAPTISISDGATFDVPENSTAVTSFTVTPSDTVPTVTPATFTLSGEGGAYSIAFATAPDYDTLTENGRSIGFTVTAGATSVNATVNVTDVDEPPTEITGAAPTAVDEVIDTTDTAAKTSPADLDSTDPENRGISWSISGSDVSYFTINNEGLLTFTVVSPDYEVKSSYSVIVTVTDDGGQTATRTITVQIGNVDEDGEITFSPKTVRAGQTVTASVTDPDAPGGITGVITWSWSNDNSDWNNPGNSPSYTTVAGDVGAALTVSVSYFDAADGNVDTVPGVTVPVLAAENSAPEIVVEAGTTSVPENDDALITVGTYTVADDDTADTHTFTLEGADKDHFAIANENTGGALTFTPPEGGANYEVKSSYSVTLKVSDGQGGSDTASVTVTVTNVDEDGEVTFSPTTVRAGQTVTASVTDPDMPDGITGTITWAWTNSTNSGWTNPGNSASYTTVAGDAGTTLTATATYLDVIGTDADTAPGTITVLAAENSAPEIVVEAGTTSVDENSATAITVGMYSATDDDTADTLTFTLEGAESSFFAIENAENARTGGNLTFTPPEGGANYEVKSSYSVTVKVTDGNGGSDTASVTVTVTNVDEDGKIELTQGPRAGGTIVASVTDPDAPNGITGVVTWTWTEINGVAPTSTTATSSYLTVADDEGEVLTVAASYFDGVEAGTDNVDAVSVTVLPAVNKAPVIRSDSGRSTITYTENGTDTMGFSAVDSDAVVLEWSVSDTENFTITPGGTTVDAAKSANLAFKRSPDFEEKASYAVTVSASDGTSTGSIAMTINILDANDDGVVTFSADPIGVGQTVTAMLDDDDVPLSGVTWAWTGVSDTDNAASASYTAVTGDLGNPLTATATYTDRHGSEQMAHEMTMAVLAMPTDTPGVVTLDPTTLKVGEKITATLEDADGGVTGEVWAWERSSNGTYVTISGAASSAYTATADDEGKRLRASVEYTDALGSGRSAMSEASGAVAAAPVVTTGGGGGGGGGGTTTTTPTTPTTPTQNAGVVTLTPSTVRVGTVVTAALSDADGGVTGAVWSWQRSSNGTYVTISGATGNQYTAAEADAGKRLRASVTYTDSIGAGQTATSAASGAVIGTPKPDLTVAQPTVNKSTVEPGEEFTLSASVKNEGNGRAAATTLRYYRSTNATITKNDTEVGTDAVGALVPNGTSAESISITAPDAVGTYYYGACVDNVANEGDTANNCSASVKITVEEPEAPAVPSLRASATPALTETTLDGATVTLTLTDGAFMRSLTALRAATNITGIMGVRISAVNRVSDTSATVVLAFDGTDFDADATLTVSVSAGAIADYTGSALTDTLSVKAVVEVEALFIYWIDRGSNSIRGASANGSRVESLVTQGLKNTRGLAIDEAAGKMYWIDNTMKTIQRADLDGSNVEALITQGLEYPRDIAVAGDKMYWTDTGTDKIQRANLDGSNVEDLVTRGLSITTGLAIDTAGGKLYWTDDGTNKIQRADLDGSNVQDLVTQGLVFPLDIALDAAGGKMYWTDVVTGKIQRASLNGSNVQDVITEARGPHSIALDAANGKIYWTDWRENKIQRANLDGSGVEDVVTRGVDRPSAIAIADSSDQPPVVIEPDDDDDDEDKTVYAAEDVNRDGSVDGQDLVYVAQRLGQTGQGDVDGDGIIGVADILLVAAAMANNMAAPAAITQLPADISAEMLDRWLSEAKLSNLSSPEYLRGIVVLEQMLAALAPRETMLLANYPNPFNPETWIPYQLSMACNAQISIYDINGLLVRQLDLGYQQAGYYTDRSRAAYWDGRNNSGERVATGVYFYRLQIPRSKYVPVLRKMVILK